MTLECPNHLIHRKARCYLKALVNEGVPGAGGAVERLHDDSASDDCAIDKMAADFHKLAIQRQKTKK